MGSFDDLIRAKDEVDRIASAISKPEQSEQKKDWLPLFTLTTCDITARLVKDLKGQFINEYCQYWIDGVPVYDEATGEEKIISVRHRVKGVWDEHSGSYDYQVNDPLWPLAKELGALYPNPKGNQYTSRICNIIYADIVEARDAAGNVLYDAKKQKIGYDDKHRLGPCIISETGKTKSFAFAFKAALGSLIRRAETKGEAAKERIGSYFDPRQPGILCDIKRTAGAMGGLRPTCAVAFDTESNDHTFAPEVIEKFADIKSECCMKFDATNERNREILMEHFKRLLSKGGGVYASPDPVRTRKPLTQPEDDELFSMSALDAAQASGR